MIDLHTWTTPNGRKVSIALEELGLAYNVRPVNIGKGEQDEDAFRAISPNGKIPAITDHEPDGGGAPLHLFESAAIVRYLTAKTGSDLGGRTPRERAIVDAWTMFQMASVGPMFGQLGHFVLFAKEDVPYAVKRYRAEVERLLGVMEKRLAGHAHLAGDAYSVADLCTYPWVDTLRTKLAPKADLDLTAYPALGAWADRVGDRGAVRRGMNVPAL